jgi:hypothetical protein
MYVIAVKEGAISENKPEYFSQIGNRDQVINRRGFGVTIEKKRSK